MAGKPTFYITTPIYYVNDVPHIGHAYTTIAADTLARFKRLQGFDVFFLTGTDEHGQKIERMAIRQGVTPQAYVDRIVTSFQRLWEKLHITQDDFIRTTSPRHMATVQEAFRRLEAQGDIYPGHYEGWYCTPCETFWLESQLVEGNCPDCGRPTEWLREEAFFFRLSRYQERLLAHIETHPEFIQPESRRHEMVNFIKSGLEDLCVSRTSFTWGIPVPGHPGHVIYVWLDALFNYLSALGAFRKGDGEAARLARYWPADVHLVGKEIMRFHTIIWPALLMALDLPLPRVVFGHGWWTVEGEKMSKSKGNVIDPGALAEELGVDAVRYFLLREVPFGADGDFSRASFLHRLNSELANDLGNLLSRTVAMVEKYQEGEVRAPGTVSARDEEFVGAVLAGARAVAPAMDALAFGQALDAIWQVIDAANKYIEDTAPWGLAKRGEVERLATVLYNLAEALRITTILLTPFLPTLPAKMWAQLGLTVPLEGQHYADACAWGLLPVGTRVHKGEALFPRLEIEKKGAAGEEGRVAPPARAEKTKDKDTADKGEKAGVSMAPEAGANLISIEDFARVDLRLGRVLQAEKVPNTDKLLRLEVDLGEGKPRQIVAGIALFYAPEELVGKMIVVVANLKPAKLRGLLSEGMLLAASNEEKTTLRVLTVEGELPAGSKIR